MVPVASSTSPPLDTTREPCALRPTIVDVALLHSDPVPSTVTDDPSVPALLAIVPPPVSVTLPPLEMLKVTLVPFRNSP